MDLPKHILLCITLWHYKKYYFWTTLFQYISDLLMLQVTNASVLDSEFVSMQTHSSVSVNMCVGSKCIMFSVRLL